MKLPVKTASGAYDVHLGEIARLPALLGPFDRCTVIADSTVRALYGDPIPGATVLEVPPGEASKSLQQAERLWTALLEAGHGRRDPIVAFGGGVVGDLAGFVAATLHRGVPFVQVPTTLLSQVDSSVGGKVAIDHPLGKNLIGAFHQPALVVADVSLLATLPVRERWSGLAEVVKAALLADPELFAILERDLEDLAERPTAEVVARSIGIKARIVAQDERESGLRQLLNLGHTVGHALELVCGYGTLTHGEAVVLGMRGALALSPLPESSRVEALLARFPIPPLPPLDRDAILAATLRDKKRVGSSVRYVVLDAIGRPALRDADAAKLREAIDAALEAR